MKTDEPIFLDNGMIYYRGVLMTDEDWEKVSQAYIDEQKEG